MPATKSIIDTMQIHDDILDYIWVMGLHELAFFHLEHFIVEMEYNMLESWLIAFLACIKFDEAFGEHWKDSLEILVIFFLLLACRETTINTHLINITI